MLIRKGRGIMSKKLIVKALLIKIIVVPLQHTEPIKAQ